MIDPAQAFGTGAHPTTRLSLELLLALEPAGPLADLGCGSGVLAIAAARLGFAPVTAFDNEPAAIEATRENARANAIRLERVERIDLREQPAPWAPTTTANLVRPLLLRLAELNQRRPERMIVSGLLEGRRTRWPPPWLPCMRNGGSARRAGARCYRSPEGTAACG